MLLDNGRLRSGKSLVNVGGDDGRRGHLDHVGVLGVVVVVAVIHAVPASGLFDRPLGQRRVRVAEAVAVVVVAVVPQSALK